MNTIGVKLRLTIFGTSHGEGVGCVIDGIPAGMTISLDDIQRELDLRRPSVGIGTPRREEDIVLPLSGLKDSKATGGALTLFIKNVDKDSERYKDLEFRPRPGHADLTAVIKYGGSHDIRGGGQFSGRMTAPIVAAGSVAKAILAKIGVNIRAYTVQIGKVRDDADRTYEEIAEKGRANDIRAASVEMAELMRKEIMDAKADGDSIGGVVRCLAVGLPIGVGEPFFDTLEGELAKMIFAIPAVKGIEFGAGFRSASMRGSQHNDPFTIKDGKVVTTKNDSGGVLGGISNGMPLDLSVAFKPTASIAQEQDTIDLRTMRPAKIRTEGRHDPCIVPRAVVVVEAAVALVLADLCIRGGFID
ncbi:MAG: chorismate synthase [Methanomassiliicoccales archaeon]|nr:MAG: chorismate synthase [Methanomassiliicoccales archaeon]